MEFTKSFIRANGRYSTLDCPVPAPYIRRAFCLEKPPVKAQLLVCGLGFYTLHVNGQALTKGHMAPYISNPDDLLYYDEYDITAWLKPGANAMAFCLGNGLQNNPGGYVWKFDQAIWRNAPQLAVKVQITLEDETIVTLESDESWTRRESPIRSDDYRNGECYDARCEIPGWDEPLSDESGWQPVERAPIPRGEPVLCTADPLSVREEVTPVAITPTKEGYLYDFGRNTSGVCRLTVQGESGQTISLYHGEYIKDGELVRRNICFDDNDYVQKDTYICKGGATEGFTPSFTYHGFRYVHVKGITAHQATPSLLTCLVIHSALPERGSFSCSDDRTNAIQRIVRQSTLTSFHYFPTDCPQREKNGWTADAALSCEHTLLNLEPERSYGEYLRTLRKAQREDGALPGIAPTGGWGFEWGNGPAWDSVLIEMPYRTYLYRYDIGILQDNAAAILRYLHYLTTQIRPDGLIACGLGDWCPVGRREAEYKAPLELTDTLVSMDLCDKAAFIFGELHMTLQQAFAGGLRERLYQAARLRLVDMATMTALGRCHTSQAMAIYYGLFTDGEKPEAVRRLIEMIHENGDKMDVGVLGGRVLFHVLAECSYSELAFTMITRPDFPSYGNWIVRGATTLWESFQEDIDRAGSLNHHFWGDVSHWFIRHLGGIHYVPRRVQGEADIRPQFVSQLRQAQAYHQAPEGRIEVNWERTGETIQLTLLYPEALTGWICLPAGYTFEDGVSAKPAASGQYTIQGHGVSAR